MVFYLPGKHGCWPGYPRSPNSPLAANATDGASLPLVGTTSGALGWAHAAAVAQTPFWKNSFSPVHSLLPQKARHIVIAQTQTRIFRSRDARTKRGRVIFQSTDVSRVFFPVGNFRENSGHRRVRKLREILPHLLNTFLPLTGAQGN